MKKKSGAELSINALDEVHAYVEGGNQVELFKTEIKIKEHRGSIVAF